LVITYNNVVFGLKAYNSVFLSRFKLLVFGHWLVFRDSVFEPVALLVLFCELISQSASPNSYVTAGEVSTSDEKSLVLRLVNTYINSIFWSRIVQSVLLPIVKLPIFGHCLVVRDFMFKPVALCYETISQSH
jgi:hypothetical protein